MSWLVENEHFFFPEQRLGKSDSLQVTLRQSLHFFVAVLLQAKELDDITDALLKLGVGDSGQSRVAHEGGLGAPSGRNRYELR